MKLSHIPGIHNLFTKDIIPHAEAFFNWKIINWADRFLQIFSVGICIKKEEAGVFIPQTSSVNTCFSLKFTHNPYGSAQLCYNLLNGRKRVLGKLVVAALCGLKSFDLVNTILHTGL